MSFCMAYFSAWHESAADWVPSATVYFFCGKQLQYCSCDFRWNVLGWCKAMVLWNFVLTTALGGQRLAILIGLNGLLPGEGGHHPCMRESSRHHGLPHMDTVLHGDNPALQSQARKS